MLDTRYIHLHEALGLGAMWLKNSAKIITNPQKETFRQPEKPKKSHNPNPQARQQLMAFVQQQNGKTETAHVVQAAAPKVQRLHIAIHPARVWVLSACPSPNDVGANRLLSGADGALLRRMIEAIELPHEQVQVSCWVKAVPTPHLVPNLSQFEAALPEMQQEKAQVQAEAILLLGDVFQRPAIQPLIAQLAGETAVFTIPHPQRVHDDSSLRRPTWTVLQRLQAHLQKN